MDESGYTALFLPTRAEARGVFKHLRLGAKTRQGPLRIYEAQARKSGRRILLVLMGMGPELSRKAAERVFGEYPIREAWILGLCGATQIGYEAGDALIAQEILSEDPSLPPLSCDPALIAYAKQLFEKLPQRQQSGRILSVGRVVEHPADKIALGQQHDCQALEMEAYPWAQAARQKAIPFLQLRWVLDPAEYAVPPLDFVDASGKPKLSSAFKTFAKQPSLALLMPPFLRKVRQALKNMNEFLHSYFEDGTIPSFK